MQEYLVQGSLNLKRSSALRVEDGRGILIYVWEGEIWVTEDGEREDRIVRKGEWHRVARNGAALCYALRRSVVTLTAPVPVDFARRILLHRAGASHPDELYNAARERSWGFRARVRRMLTGLARPFALRATAA